MIVDWKRNCEKIHATNTLQRSDPSDNKIYFKQEIVYIRYLINSGASFDECFNKWQGLSNGVASSFGKDFDQLRAQFSKTYLKAKTKTYSFVDSADFLKPISLYASEIKKIDSLQCDKWVKEYILTLLIYYKFAHQLIEKVEYSTTLVNWILRQVDIHNYKFRSYRDARKTIGKVIRESRFKVLKFVPIKKNGHYSTYNIPFLTDSGEEVAIVNSLDDLKSAFDLLRSDSRICVNCGIKFGITSKTKTMFCPDCYKKFRRAYKTKKDREYYHRDKNKAFPDSNVAVLVYERGSDEQ